MARNLFERLKGQKPGQVGDSSYDDAEVISKYTRRGLHREAIGGMWDQIGALQLSFLRSNGLQPSQTFLDVGCGSLRAGVHLIPFLEPGKYWGIDINQSLLDAGWNKELGELQNRQPREQLVVLDDFQFDRLGVSFDMAVATSVFTHLSFNRIRRCLRRLAPTMKPGGVFYATFFEPTEQDPEEPNFHDRGGVSTYSYKDPFHYSQEDVAFMVQGLQWRMEWLGEWDHPRDQQMVRFTRE